MIDYLSSNDCKCIVFSGSFNFVSLRRKFPNLNGSPKYVEILKILDMLALQLAESWFNLWSMTRLIAIMKL